MPKVKRKIVKIDEEKCTGCGDCIPSCVEGALRIVDSKAKLVSERYCDGLGACLGKCPVDAISIEEREVEEFDLQAAERHKSEEEPLATVGGSRHVCPGSAMFQFQGIEEEAAGPESRRSSALRQWPVKLELVPPNAPYFRNADLLLVADCAPVAYRYFHEDFLKGRALVIGCPKLNDSQLYLAKLAAILRHSRVRSLTVLHMEVPCCYGLVHVARAAIEASGKKIALVEKVMGIRGELKSEEVLVGPAA